MSEPKYCFVIAPIGDPDSETRKRSDQILKHVIRPAAEACGYKAVRADEIDRPGLITSQVIQRVVNDCLVIADLTERNPNVFYELAIRHAIRKPLVQIIKRGEQIPFDIAGTRTIHVDHHDLDSVEAAKGEIISQVKSLERDASELDTPISVSLELQLLRQSDNPMDRSLADLVGTISELRASVSMLEARLEASDGQDLIEKLKSIVANLVPRLDRLEKRGRQFYGSSHIHAWVKMGHVSLPNPIGMLVLASPIRDEEPWLYELILEAYRAIRDGDLEEGIKILDSAKRIVMLRDRHARPLFSDELSELLDEIISCASTGQVKRKSASSEGGGKTHNTIGRADG
jgi:hypothetical protein